MGTISEKLTYLNNTKQQIKENLNKFGSNITENDTFRSYSNVINDIYDKLPKVSANGTEFTLENAQNGKLDSFGMDGNTQQTTYSGIQLFNVHDNPKYDQYITLEEDYITCERTNTGTEIVSSQIYTNNLNVQPSTTYLCVCEIIEVSGTGSIKPVSRWVNQNQGQFNYDTAYAFSSLTAGQKLIYPVTTFADLSNKTRGTRTVFEFQAGEGGRIKIRLSILADTTITSDTFVYEPYVGGTPSPNPDYPQDVKVVTGDNTIKVTNELKDSNNVINAYLNSSEGVHSNNNNKIAYIPIEDNKTYTIKKILSDRFRIGLTDVLPNGNDNPIYNYLNIDDYENYSLTNTNHKYLCIWYWNSNDTLTEQEIFNSMSIYSSIQTYPLNLGNLELCKIDTYKDSIKKSTGKNLFDGGWSNGSIGSNGQNISDSKSIRTTGIVVKSGVQYTFSSSTTTSINEFWINYYNGDTFVSREYFSSGNAQTFIVPSGVNIVRFRLTATTNIDTNIINNVQLEQNSSATSYEPFGTDWYIKKEIGKVVLDGSEDNWNSAIFRELTDVAGFRQNVKYSLNMLSDKFIYNTPQYLYDANVEGITYSSTGNYFVLYINKNRLSSVSLSALKTWLSTHNTTVYYVLDTPTYETITDETLISQLESIETITGLNNFSVSNDNNVLPTLYVSRLKELGKLE